MVAPIKVLFVNPSPVRGGAEQMLLDLCVRASRLDPLVVSLAPGPFPDELVKAGVRHELVDARRLRYPWAWARTVGTIAALARDAALVFSWQVKGQYYGTPAARRARTRAAWWDHGIRPRLGQRRYVIDGVLPRSMRADLVVCSSLAAASEHRGAIAIHPGIDAGRFERTSRAEARERLGVADDVEAIGISGRLQPWKRQHEFLRAAPEIVRRHPRARFFVIGGTPGGFSAGYAESLHRMAAQLGIADRVTFTGQIEDVATVLPGLDVAVHASSDEPFGLVVLEAMAAGVPVVAHPSGGVPEIVANGEHGLLTADIANGVNAYLDDPGFAARMAGAARERARTAFSVDRFVRDTEGAVVSLVGA